MIIKLCDFTKGGTDIDQLNDHTALAKSCRWVMEALLTLWCLKHKEDISKFSSYNVNGSIEDENVP